MKPARIRRATASERSSEPDITLPANPYVLSLAIRIASSSSSNGMTASTGPKISSWAIVMELSTSVKSVGLTKNPLSKPVGASGPADQRRGALFDALVDVAHHAIALLLRDHRAAQRSRVLRVTRT